jgi:signal transduction histidine kinase
MRLRTWPVAAVGLLSLLGLVVVSVLAASSRAQEIYSQLEQLNAHHREVDAELRRLRSDVQLAGIFMRDYLLDAEPGRGADYRRRLAELRRNSTTSVSRLRELTKDRAGHDTKVASLEAQLDAYWRARDPVFDWTPAERLNRSGGFLQREIFPQREAVFAIALQIEELNNANLVAQRAEVTRRQEAFRSDLHKLLWRSLFLGVLVALVAVTRLRVLERRSEQQRTVAEEAERHMRQLSQQIVATQEEERKSLSRELHDQVGQTLTALRLELGRIDRVRPPAETAIGNAVGECRQLVDNLVRTVRDLSLGLRPSMLDDFGLQAALEWLVRDVGRRHGGTVDLRIEGTLDGVPEQYRTSVYRIVQEALTNCVRHARADRLSVDVTRRWDSLEISITDNGVGLDPARARAGLGLRGIEERAKELNGTVRIVSPPGGGTTVAIVLPLPARPTEVTLARAAG